MGLMENGGGGLSIADAMALANGNNGGMFGGSGGVFIAILFLFFILSRGNGLFGGNGGFSNSPAAQGAITRAEMMDGFNFNQIENGIRGLERGLCDGFYNQSVTTMQGFNGINQALCHGFNGVDRAIAENRYAAEKCCCETNRNIDAVRYENSKNTCDIITSGNMNTRDIIDSQNAGFQRVIDFMTNDKIESLRSELQAANFALHNNAQTQTLISTLRPCPVPAYPSCSPYEVFGGGARNHDCGCCC